MDMPVRRRPTEGQLNLARVLATGESTEGRGITKVPASVYTDPARFAAGEGETVRPPADGDRAVGLAARKQHGRRP